MASGARNLPMSVRELVDHRVIDGEYVFGHPNSEGESCLDGDVFVLARGCGSSWSMASRLISLTMGGSTPSSGRISVCHPTLREVPLASFGSRTGLCPRTLRAPASTLGFGSPSLVRPTGWFSFDVPTASR